MTRIFRSLITTSRTQMHGSNAQQTPATYAPDDTFVHVKPDEKIAQQLTIRAGEKILEKIIKLERMQAETQTPKILNRSAEMTHTASNPQLAHKNKVVVLDLMKQIFAEDDELTLAEFRNRLEGLVLKKTNHFLGFEY